MSGMLRESLAGTGALALTAGVLVAASVPAAAAITRPDHPLVDEPGVVERDPLLCRRKLPALLTLTGVNNVGCDVSAERTSSLLARGEIAIGQTGERAVVVTMDQVLRPLA